MRILHLSTLYPPHIVGGAERSVGMLADSQVQRGHKVAAACLSPDAWKQEERNGVLVYRMPHENSFWMEEWPQHSQRRREWAKFKQQANFAIERSFRTVIESFRPDIINTHSLVDISTRVWHAARRCGVPVVHTLRDFDLLCAASSMYRETGPCTHRHLKCRVLTFTKQFDQRLVDGVTAVGRDVLARHLDFGFFRHVPQPLRRVIWNTASVDRADEPPVRPRSADHPFTFGYLGRISPEKGVDTLLRAARRLPPAGWQLKIAGAAPDAMQATRALANGLPVEFLGFVKPNDLFDQVDVLIVPSLWAEPLGRSVLESYLAGVPVIGSRTGGIAEIINDDDWLFTPGDDGALARMMNAVLRRGRSWLPTPDRFAATVERTRPDTVAEAFDEVYRAVLANRQSSGDTVAAGYRATGENPSIGTAAE